MPELKEPGTKSQKLERKKRIVLFRIACSLAIGVALLILKWTQIGFLALVCVYVPNAILASYLG